jgi:N6-adenosine-specific RNA methylase IME4
VTTLAQYERLRAALAEARRVDQVLPLLDEIEHVKLYARQIEDRELLADASVAQMEAERHLGIVIKAAKEAGHFRQGKRKSSDEELSRGTLKEVGIKRKLSARAQKAASISERAYAAMLARQRERIAAGGAIVLDPLSVAEKEVIVAKRKADHGARTHAGGKVEDLHKLAASGFKARAILADPAWEFIARSAKGDGRSASQHYNVQALDAIKSLPVAQLAADDCALFIWMLDWCPRWALEVIEAWGFEHKTTAFTWVKLTESHNRRPRVDGTISDRDFHFGQGYWTRANPEDCWLATRGSPKRIHADVRQLIVAPVMEHSEKPRETHARIERLVDGPYLEFNARREVEGWLTFGDEIPFRMPAPPHDSETGEIIETEAQAKGREQGSRGPQCGQPCCDDTPVVVGASSPAPVATCCAAGAAPVDDIDIPAFLRREPNNAVPTLPPPRTKE